MEVCWRCWWLCPWRPAPRHRPQDRRRSHRDEAGAPPRRGGRRRRQSGGRRPRRARRPPGDTVEADSALAERQSELRRAEGRKGVLEQRHRQPGRAKRQRAPDQHADRGSAVPAVGQGALRVSPAARRTGRSARALPAARRYALLHGAERHGVHRAARAESHLPARRREPRVETRRDGTGTQASVAGRSESHATSAIRSATGKATRWSSTPSASAKNSG